MSVAADPECFTGSVWSTVHLPRLGADGLIGHRFSYAPGARSYWHVHDGDQALVVVGGRGLAHWTGLDAARARLPGDWGACRSGRRALARSSRPTRCSSTSVTASGGTHWLAAVTDAHYLRAQAAFS